LSVIKLSIVIVSYNVKTFLQQTLESVYKASSDIECEIFVVDNSSLDGSAEMVESKFPEVNLIRNDKNLGFAKANNQAIDKSNGEFILLLNPDTVVQEDTFSVLIDFFGTHPEAGAAGCKVLNADGTLQPACRRSSPTPMVVLPKILGLNHLFPKSKIFGKYNLTYLDEDELSEVDAVSGSCVMVRKEVIEKVGTLDEDFFMYGEDLDWFYRMRMAGYKIFYVPQTKIIHYKGESTKAVRYDVIGMFYKAQIKFVKKHFSKSKSFLSVMFLYIGIIMRASLSYAAKISGLLAPAALDILLIQISISLALMIKFGSLAEWNSYLSITLIYTFIWLITFYVLKMYDRRRYSATFAAWGVILGFFVNTTFTFFFKQFAYSREVLIWLLLFNIILLPSWRIFIRLAQRTKWIPYIGTLGKTLATRRTAIIGSSDGAREIADKINEQVDQGYNIVGFIGTDSPLDFPEEYVYLGNISEIDEIVKIRKITNLIFSTEFNSYEEILSIIDKMKHLKLNFKIVAKDLDFIIGKSSVEPIDDISFLDMNYNIDKLTNRVLKRSFDIILSFPLLIALFPFAIIYSIATGFSFNRMTFHTYDGHKKSALFLSDGADKKRNRMAGYPLLYHIFLGNLSFVGSEIQPGSSSEDMIRLKPGLTSLTEIMRRKESNREENARYEQYYLRNQSIRLDIEILIKNLFHF